MSLVATRSSARSTTAKPSATLGAWELVQRASAGEFATVYRARPSGSTNAAADYAIKVARTDRPDRAACWKLLANEADVAARVAHPHLVAVLSAQLEHERPHLAMPWLRGATLRARLDAGQRFALPVALAIVRQIASALAALAEQGYRHGDVKPSNIMVSPEGHATLLDLGFACDAKGDAAATERTWLGTPRYAAPERFAARHVVTSQSDVFSLGVVTYLLLTGEHPFADAPLDELAQSHLETPTLDPRNKNRALPPEVAQLTLKMLAKEPLRRPAPDELVVNLARQEINALGNYPTNQNR
jgi:serine/threonine protein kinase